MNFKNMAKFSGIQQMFRRLRLCAVAALLTTTPVLGEERTSTATVGGRFGNDYGEAYLSVFAPLNYNENSVIFLNPRFALKDEGAVEGNLGLGFRTLIANDKAIFGANIYADRSETIYDNSVSQWGLGLEFLTDSFDFRANYYDPGSSTVIASTADISTMSSVTDVERSVVLLTQIGDQQVGSRTVTEAENYYLGNNIANQSTATTTDRIRTTTTNTTTTTSKFTTTKTFTDLFFEKREGGLEGYDFELGYKLPLGDRLPEVRLFGGYYDFEGPFNSEIKGAKSRLEIRAGEYFTFDAEVFEDEELHGSDYFLGARLNLPFSMTRLFDGKNPFSTSQNDIASYKARSLRTRLGEEVIRDVNVHVAESSFDENLSKRASKDEVTVREEVEVDVETKVRERDEVSIVREEYTYTRDGDNLTVTHVDSNATGSDSGTFEDPNATITSANATQATDANDIVLVHSDSSFDGETVQVTDNQAVIGQGGGIENTVATDQGDLLLPEAGNSNGATPTINNGGVQINSTNVTVSNLSIDGGSITTGTSGTHSDLTITNVSISNSVDDAISLGDGGTLGGEITLSNITIEDSGDDGIDINNLLAGAELNVSNVQVTRAGDDSIDIDDVGVGAQLMFSDIASSMANDAGMTIYGVDENTVANFSNYSASMSGSDGIRVGDVNAGSSFTFNDIAITDSDEDGIYLDDISTTATFAFNDLDVSGSADDGVEIDDSRGTFTFDANSSLVDNEYGLYVDEGTATITYSGSMSNQASHSYLIDIEADGGSVTFDSAASDALVGNAGGIYISGGADVNIVADAELMGDAGVEIYEADGTLNFTDTDINVDGVALRIDDSEVNVTFGSNSSITQTSDNDAVRVVNGDDSTLNFNGAISATDGRGLRFSGADGTYNINGTTVLNGGNAGVDIVNDSDGTFVFGSNTSITNPSGRALDINGGSADVNFMGSITNNAGNSVRVRDMNGGSVNINTGSITHTGASTGINIQDNINADIDIANLDVQSSGARGVNISGNSGTIDFTNGSIANANTAGFRVEGGDAEVTYGGDITNNAGRMINILDTTGGSVTFENGSLSHTGGTNESVQISNVAGDVSIGAGGMLNIQNVDSRGIDITGGSGSFTFENANIQNTSGDAFSVNGGDSTVSFNGNITQNNAGRLIDINNRSGGLITFETGSVLTATGSSQGIRVRNATAANTVSFNGAATVGTTGNELTGSDGVVVNNNGTASTVSFANLNVETGNSQNGLAASGGGTIQVLEGNLSAIGTNPGGAGRALDLNGITSDITLTSITSDDSNSQGIDIDNTDGSLTVSGAVDIDNSDSAGIDIRNSSLAANFNGAVTVANSAANGIDLRNNTGSINFNGSTTVNNAAEDGINLRNNDSGVVIFDATNITLGNTAGATGIDYDGNNNGGASFGATTITGLGNGANQVGINFNNAGLTGQQSYLSVDISGLATSTDSIAVDLSRISGNQIVHLGEQVRTGASSHITEAHRGVVIDNTAAVQFVFGDGEDATDTGSTIDVNGLAGSFTVDAAGGTLAASSFNFEDIVVGAGDVANLPAAANAPVFVSTAGGIVSSGTNNLSNDLTTITVGAALGQANVGQNFVFVGDGVGGIDVSAGMVGGFALIDGQSIESFNNGNAITSGSLQPSNLTGDIGGTGFTTTSDDVVASNTDAGATSVINITGSGNNMVSNLDIQGSNVTGAAVLVRNVTTDPVTLSNVGIDNGANTAVSLMGNAADVTLNNVDLVDISGSAPNTGTALFVSGASHAGQVTVGSGSDLGNTTGTVLAANVSDNVLNIDTSGSTINVTASTQNVIDIAGLAAGSNINLGGINADGVTADNVINIQNFTGGTVTTQEIAITNNGDSATDTAINIAGSGGVVNIAELDIATNNGNALAMEGQTLTITSTDNDITATNGQAINLDGTAINPGGVTFNQVSGNSTTLDAVALNDTTGGSVTFTSVTLAGGPATSGLSISGNSRSSDVIVSGGTISNGTAISGGGTGSVTIDANISTAAGYAVQVSSRGAAAGLVDINGTVTSNTGAVSIQSNTGGNIQFDGVISGTGANNAGVIDIDGNTGGVIDFNDLVDIDTSGNGTGVAIGGTNTAGAVINFNNGLDVNTVNGIGFNAQGGTVGVANAATETVNTSGTATAINIDGATVAAGGINFDTVSTAASATADAVIIDDAVGGDITLASVNLNGGAVTTGLDVSGDSRTSNVIVGGGNINNGVAVQGVGAGAVTVDAAISTSAGYALGLANRSATSGLVDINGNITSATGAVSVQSSTGGDVNIDGSVTATGANTAGAVDIDNVTGGTIAFNGAVDITLTGSGVGVDMNNNIGSTTNFTGGLDIDTASGTGFNAFTSGTVSVTGVANSIDTGSGRALTFSDTTVGAGGLNFANVTNTTANAFSVVEMTNVSGGDVTFGTSNLVGSGIRLAGTLGSVINLGDVDIALNADNQTALDLSSAAINANLSASDFDVTSSSVVGTIGVNLAGTTGTATVQLGDTVVAGDSSSIAGVNEGLLFSNGTNLNFIFGDGEETTDALSSIVATTALAGTLPSNGNYNLLDVGTLTGNVVALGGPTVFWVDQAQSASNDGSSAALAGSVVNAEASTANVIALVDTNIDGTSDAINSAANSLDLDDGQILVSFADGDGNIDITTLGFTGSVGAPSSFQFNAALGISGSTIINAPTSGIDTVHANLVTTSDTVTLAGSAGIANVNLVSNGGTAIVGDFASNETVIISGGTIDGISMTPTAGTTTLTLNGVNLTSSLNLDASGAGAIALNTTGINTIATVTEQILNLESVALDASGISFASLAASGTIVSGSAINLNATTGGTFNGGNVTIAGQTAGTGISISDTTSGAISFGAVNINGAAATTGLNVSGNARSSSVAIASGSIGNGVSVSGSGTGTVTVGANLSTSAGYAVQVSGRGASAGLVEIDGTVTSGTGAVSIQSNTGGNVQFDGVITATGANTAGAIDIDNTSGGVVDFNALVDIDVTGSGTGIAMQSNTGNTVNFNGGLDVDAQAGTAFSSTSGGTINFNGVNNSLSTTTGEVINISGSTVNGTITDASATALNGNKGIDINNHTGSLTVTGGNITNSGNGTSIEISAGAGALNIGSNVNSSGATGLAVDVTGRTGGSITLAGNFTDNNTSGGGLSFVNNSGGTTAFTGNATANTGANSSVSVNNSAAHSVTFSGLNTDFDTTSANTVSVIAGGNLVFNSTGTNTINATTGSAFIANGGGNVTVGGTADLTTTVGTGVDIQNTTIGAAGVTFGSVSSNGAVNGILLNNTGSTGAFNVVGDGASVTLGGNASGGVIQNTSGDAISLTNTGAVNLTDVRIINPAGDGIDIVGMTGTSRFDQLAFLDVDQANTSAVRLLNDGAQNLNLTIDNSQFLNSTTGQSLVLAQFRGNIGNSSFNVEDSFWDNNSPASFQIDAYEGSGVQTSGTLTHNFLRNTLQNAAALGTGDTAHSCGGGAVCNYTISDNTYDDLFGAGNFNSGMLNAGYGGGAVNASSQMTLVISGNELSHGAAGAGQRRGINIINEPTGASVANPMTVTVSNNTIDDLGDREALYFDNRSGGGGLIQTVNLTVSGNDFGTGALAGSTANNIGGTRDAVFINSEGASTVNVLFDNNTIGTTATLTDSIVEFDAEDSSSLNITMTNNTLSSTSDAAVLFESEGASSVCIDIRNNVTTNTGAFQYDFEENSGTSMTVEGVGTGAVTSAQLLAAPHSNTGVSTFNPNAVSNNGSSNCNTP